MRTFRTNAANTLVAATPWPPPDRQPDAVFDGFPVHRERTAAEGNQCRPGPARFL